jgi:quercetin dioxygenase-like cupin family protein
MSEGRVVRSGEGDVYDAAWIFKHGARTGGPFDFMIGSLNYLTGPPLHVHREQHDSFYVLEGVLTFQLGEEVLELRPGDFVSAPPGVPHTFDNTKKDGPPVKVCNILTPGGFDQFMVRLGELGSASEDPTVFAAAAETFGIIMVGPTLAEKLGLRMPG